MALPIIIGKGLASTGLAGKIIGGVGGLLGGLFSSKAARRRNKLQRELAQKQMDFQERMSSTAHQREVEDLRAAGLNPILSATGGRGASSPGGAMAQLQDEITPALSSALQVARTKADLTNIGAQTKLLKSQENQARASTLESRARTGKTYIETDSLEEMLKGLKIEGKIDQTKIGEITRYLNRIFGTGASARGMIK